MRALLVISLLLCAGCSQTLLTRQDYQNSRADFAKGDYQQALQDFPRGREDGDFITTMEKGYLSLLLGKPQIQGLTRQAAAQENQVRYHVSREARTFFYVRTPEDYYPSEHEVIWLHFLLGWGYALQGKYSDACVEARVASSLLTLPWAPAGHFDDPTMRLFLAGLWTMCGEWREAQVDFRAAWNMDNSLIWARELAERDKPPAQLFIVLGGPGPDVVWDPDFQANPLRAGRRVSFRLNGRKSTLFMADQSGRIIPTHLSPDAGNWYQRHLARESELDELIQDSAYGGRAAASGAKATAIIAGETGEGIVGGIVGGALVGLFLIADIASKSPGTQISVADVKGAVIIGGVLGGIVGGAMGASEGYKKGSAEVKEALDASIHYRYVRYLPEYLWMAWSDQPVPYPVKVSTPGSAVEIPQPTVVNGVSVSITHLPDGRERSCVYRQGGGSTTIVTEPDADGNCPKDPDL